MRKSIVIVLVIVVSALLTKDLISQDINNPENLKNQRHISINSVDDFFSEYTDGVYIAKFELYNIMEGESSKPVFVAVNEIPGVRKFSIKSRSENIANQRSCYVEIYENNYLETLKMMIHKMEIQFIKYKENMVSVHEFNLLISDLK